MSTNLLGYLLICLLNPGKLLKAQLWKINLMQAKPCSKAWKVYGDLDTILWRHPRVDWDTQMKLMVVKYDKKIWPCNTNTQGLRAIEGISAPLRYLFFRDANNCFGSFKIKPSPWWLIQHNAIPFPIMGIKSSGLLWTKKRPWLPCVT